MSEWTTLTLGEICAEGGGFVRTGPFGAQLHKSDYVDDPDAIPVVMPKDMTGGSINLATIARVDVETADRLSEHLLAAGDVALSRRGDVGRSAFIDADDLPVLCGTGSMRVHLGEAKSVKPQFLRYFFRSRLASDYLAGHAVGATMPNLNASIVNAMHVPVPPVGVQESVGEVLSSIDDLIENNRRRVEVLEEVARAIYREWFVHLRFPGHEDATFVDSDLGPIPEGWRVSTCGEELTFVGGGTPSKKELSYWDGGTVDWFTPSDLTKSKRRYPVSSSLQITEDGLAHSSAKLFPEGTVMMTSRATLGVLALATGPATTNQGFISVLPDDRWPPNFIREYLDASADELAAIATGATFKEITKGSFKSFPFLVPSQHVLDEYKAATESAEQTIGRLEQSAERLAGIRDLLLPRLVTGEIDVSDLDLDALVEGAAV